MQNNEIYNKDNFSTIIINELKDIGVKYRKDKKPKVVQASSCRKRIFRTNLHLLELTDVILANGSVVQIPKFVADACNRILEQVEVEGIFRKAGSSIRQKDIRVSLEAGLPLGKLHHVIDVANVVKYFFRELPDPIIPPSMQETLLRSLFIGENHIRAILLTCLLLPPLTINTLSFFMQFLYTISLNAHANKMSVENLAIIFTPGLMPFSDIASHRFTNHVKMVRLLIENANSIGTIPNYIIDKLQINEVLTHASSTTPQHYNYNKSKSCEKLEVIQQTKTKKKKRRSGSLTQMFNGLRKIVGSAIGSAENLENSPENKRMMVSLSPSSSSNILAADQQQQPFATPCHKSTKKRKFADPVCAFSAKKKRDLLALLPNNSGGFLPNTPLTKETKKSRLSLGGRRHIKNISLNPVVTSMERRWSIVGSGWSRQKNKNNTLEQKFGSHNNKLYTVESSEQYHLGENLNLENDCFVDDKLDTDILTEDDTVCISKNEYEAIKERVTAIETRISQEFDRTKRKSLSAYEQHLDALSFTGPERVQNKYEQIVVDTEALSLPSTEQLAQRLSRGLKIRRSVDQQIIRSPSARKIGTIRRRSQEKARVSRNQTWHLSSTATGNKPSTCHAESVSVEVSPFLVLNPNSFYAKSNLKRGRPNTLNTGLIQQQFTPATENQPLEVNVDMSFDKQVSNEQWTSGEVFFSDVSVNQKLNPLIKDSSDIMAYTPIKPNSRQIKPKQNDCIHTPMLPPKSLPRKHSAMRTPSSAIKLATTNKTAFGNSIVMVSTPVDEEINGRASITRLRTQNAGMVMAKAKLFDNLGGGERQLQSENGNENPKSTRCKSRLTPSPILVKPDLFKTPNIFSQKEHENKTTSTIFENSPNQTKLSKKIAKSPGSIKKQRHCLSVATTKYPSCKQVLLNKIVTNEKLFRNRKLNDKSLIQNIKNIKQNHDRPLGSTRTPKERKDCSTNINSPRRKRNHSVTTGTTSLQMQEIPINVGTLPITFRNSPRFVRPKGGRHFAV